MTLGRSGPLKRSGGLKRTGGPKRTRKAIAPRSDVRVDEMEERRALVRRVLAATPRCVAGIHGICRHDPTEVNELKRRSQWRAGYLVDWNTEGLCSPCHAHVTANPGRDGWAMRHGHQVSGEAGDAEYVIAIAARYLGWGCPRSCEVDHRAVDESGQ